MVRSSRFNAWLLSAASLTLLASGCNSIPKSPETAGLKPQTPAAVTSSATGSPDIATGNKLKDPVKVHLAYALWHEQEGNRTEARISYDKVLKLSPKNVDAIMGLARLDVALGRMDEAEARLVKAQKLAPKNPKVAISLGQYYSARKNWPTALEHMTLARSLAPYDPACAYHLGFVQAKSGDLMSALANFTEAVGAAEAQYNLAYILHQDGNLVAAEEHLQQAIALKPELAQAQSLLITVQQQRHGNKGQLLARTAAWPGGSQNGSVQRAGYSVPAQVSSFDPAPPRP